MSLEHPSFRSIGIEQRKWINRRGTIRYQCAPATVGKVSCGVREELLPVWVLDLSIAGAGIALDRPLPIGQEVAIEITCPGGTQKLQFSARVIHSSEQLGSGWLVGLQFFRQLTEEELDLLLN